MSIRLRQAISPDVLSSSARETISSRLLDLNEGSHDAVYKTSESFLAFLDDQFFLKDVANLVKDKTHNGLPKVTFVVGIGGANLATKAIYDAVVGNGELQSDGRQMVFLDTLDQDINAMTEGIVDSLKSKEDFILVVVSKSGKTLESLLNTEFIISRLEKKFTDATDRIVVISTQTSPLSIEAEKKGIYTYALPDILSDRFSAFSPTTIIPLALHGFLFEDFISEARKFRDAVLDGEDQVPLLTAGFVHSWYQKGFTVYDLFFFAPHLETLGKWQRQLVAESLGKMSATGERRGITPTVSIGTTDLHSSLQLVLGGPAQRVTRFVSVESRDGQSIGDSSLDLLPASVLEKKPGEIMNTIMTAVEESYQERNLPFVDVALKDTSLKSIGAYMVYAMFETIFIGALWQVDVFSQPDVEAYKTETRNNLSL